MNELSKYLCLLLRHQPAKAELDMDEHGWVSVEQLINGVNMIVILRTRSLGRVRVDITAGTVQPKPINIGTILRPERPIFLKSLSITKATLAI